MQGPNNIFTGDANMLAALTGRGSPNLISVITTGNLYNISGTTSIDPVAGMFQQLVTGAGNTTLQSIGVGLPGQLLLLEVANDSGGARTITFGSNFRSTATLVGTSSRSMLIEFVSNGVKWMEVGRTVAIV